MRIAVDTNVVMDVLLHREPFYVHSFRVMELIRQKKLPGWITANTITDIAYLLGRNKLSGKEIRTALAEVVQSVGIIDVQKKDIIRALASPVEDFEDALLSACAFRNKCDYIVTRNEADFAESPIAAVTPEGILRACPL